MNRDDYETILLLSATCSLATSPGDKDNWIERSGPGGRGGGLPSYICQVARAILRGGGKSRGQAISIAVSRVKKWAAGADGVNADTVAKAQKAVAAWEALKAKNKAKKVVSASYVTSSGEEDNYLMLTNIPSFKTDIVRMAFNARQNDARKQWDIDHPYVPGVTTSNDYFPYMYITELWTDFIIVNCDSSDDGDMYKIPYTVDPISNKVTFGDPVEVKQQYVEISDESLSDDDLALLKDILEG